MAGAPTRTRTAVRYSPAQRVGPCAGLRAQSQSWLTEGSRSSRKRRQSTSWPAAARSAAASQEEKDLYDHKRTLGYVEARKYIAEWKALKKKGPGVLNYK